MQCLANESAGGKAVVVLAEREKADMEEDINKHLRTLRGTRVLCRCAAAACKPFPVLTDCAMPLAYSLCQTRQTPECCPLRARSGNPLLAADLTRVSVDVARAVVVRLRLFS